MYTRVHYARETIIETACQKQKKHVANLLMVLVPFWTTFEPVPVHQPVEDCPCFPNFQSLFFAKRCVLFLVNAGVVLPKTG